MARSWTGRPHRLERRLVYNARITLRPGPRCPSTAPRPTPHPFRSLEPQTGWVESHHQKWWDSSPTLPLQFGSSSRAPCLMVGLECGSRDPPSKMRCAKAAPRVAFIMLACDLPRSTRAFAHPFARWGWNSISARVGPRPIFGGGARVPHTPARVGPRSIFGAGRRAADFFRIFLSAPAHRREGK